MSQEEIQQMTTTNSSTPPWLQAAQMSLLSRANTLSNQPYQEYGGQTVASLDPGQTQAIQNLTNTANLASNLDPTSNPMWASGAQAITDQYRKGTAAQTDAAFARSGAYGGSAYRDQVGTNQTAYGNALGGLYANLYNTGIQNSLNANNALMGASGVQQSNTQAGLTDAYQRWQQRQQAPAANLDILGNAVNIAGGGNGISTSTTSGGNQGK